MTMLYAVAGRGDRPALTSRLSAKYCEVEYLSRSEIEKRAEGWAGKWAAYNDDPTSGRRHVVGRGAHTPVPPWSGITWDVHVPPKASKVLRAEKSRLPGGPKNPPDYDTDDPYRPGGPLAIAQSERFAKAQCGQPGYSTSRLGTDAAYKGGQYQPAYLVPGQCWERFTRQPQNVRLRDERAENDDAADYGLRPIYGGKRSVGDRSNTMTPDTWSVSAPCRSEGQHLPGMRWSTANVECYVCGCKLPGPHGKRKYCDGCKREADNARDRRQRAAGRRRDRRLTGWVDVNNRNGRTGTTTGYDCDVPKRYPAVRCWRDRRQAEELAPICLDVRRQSRLLRSLPWSRGSKAWEIVNTDVTKMAA